MVEAAIIGQLDKKLVEPDKVIIVIKREGKMIGKTLSSFASGACLIMPYQVRRSEVQILYHPF